MYDRKLQKWGSRKYQKRSASNTGQISCGHGLPEQSPELVTLSILQRHSPIMVRRPLSRDATAFDMEEVLSSLQVFYSYHYEDKRSHSPSSSSSNTSVPSSPPTAPTEMPLVQQTWIQLQDCIYLFKLNDITRAQAGLKRILQLPPKSIICQCPEIIVELCSSLAPINTTRYPYVRTYLLSHLLKAATSEFGPRHPVTIITSHLARDTNNQDVSCSVLNCVEQLVADRDASFALKVRLAEVDNLRREGDLSSAKSMAEEAVASGRSQFGAESQQYRSAARTLTHVLIKTAEYARALDVCRTVVGRQTNTAAYSYEDYDAVRGMEDLAEIHRLMGDFRHSSLWLSAAADLSLRLVGGSLTTVHIVDKLLAMTSLAGRSEEVEVYRREYVEIL